jgi:hypothetical protein
MVGAGRQDGGTAAEVGMDEGQGLVGPGWALDKARPLLLAAPGGESSDAAAVWPHARGL